MNQDELYLDALLGRMVIAGNNRPVGRLEEFHAEQRGDYFYIVAFAIGSAFGGFAGSLQAPLVQFIATDSGSSTRI